MLIKTQSEFWVHCVFRLHCYCTDSISYRGHCEGFGETEELINMKSSAAIFNISYIVVEVELLNEMNFHKINIQNVHIQLLIVTFLK